MRNLAIVYKFLAVMGAFGVFTLAVSFYSAIQMWSIDSSYSELGSGPTHAAFAVARANRYLTALRLDIADLMIASTDAENKIAKSALNQAKTSFVEELKQAAEIDSENKNLYKEFESRGLDIIEKSCGATIRAGAESNAEAATLRAQTLYKHDCAPTFTDLANAMQTTAGAVSSSVDKKDSALTEVTKGAIAITFLLILGGLVAVMIGGFFCIQSWIVRPIRGLCSTMECLARGELNTLVAGTERRDEIGAMSRTVKVFKENALKTVALETDAVEARGRAEKERVASEAAAVHDQQTLVINSFGAGLKRLSSRDLTYHVDDALPREYEALRADFNGATEQLREAIATIVDRTKGLRSGTSEITQASEDLSKRTEQQAASLEETAAALNNITATVRKTAEGAIEARRVVAMAKTDAEKSGEVVREAVEAMSEIENSSRKVSQIIGVIDEIAFQTNLLALNAGVEAARAGEAGRGFAVVASEVRALAQRSAEAAKEIKALISASSDQVTHGVDRVGETGKALDRISGQVGKINDVINQIAASAEEQATGLGEVNTAMNQMDQFTQKNAAMVQEATAAAQNLRQEAEAVDNLVAQFHIGDPRHSARGDQGKPRWSTAA